LASLLLADGHEVRVLENRPDVLDILHQELPTEVIYEGDGTDPQILEAAEIQRAQVLAAVGGVDADNLMAACQARFQYGVKRIIGRVNNPLNAWLFTKEFGVDVALNQANIMAKLIEEEMSLGDMMTMLKLRRGKYSLVEEKIYPGAKAVGKTLKELSLPANFVMCGLIRDGEVVLPSGETLFREGDEVLALVDDQSRSALAMVLGRPQLEIAG
jgi:trk system potassium uptake protein TrkA